MIYLDMSTEEFFKLHPELMDECIATCKEMNVDIKNIKPFITKDSIGVEIDEDGLCTISTMKDQSIFYN